MEQTDIEETGVKLPQSSTGRIDERVQRLIDCEEIRQAMYAYARGVDRLDEDLIRAAYHPDAWDDHGNFRGDREVAVATIMNNGRTGNATASMHHIGNMLIDLNGDVADVETYFVAYQRREEGEKAFTRMRAGRYLDRFERRDGRWRVARRVVVDDWSRLDEVLATAAEVGPNSTIGTRHTTDVSYEIRGFVADRKS